MKFKKIGLNAAESDEGFIVRRKSKNVLEYIEEDRVVLIEVEPGKGLAVYISALEIDSISKERITKNICKALDFLKIKYVLA